MWKYIFVLGVLTSILSCISSADESTGVVRGYVYAGSRPVCGIAVYAEANNQYTERATTSNKGFFVFLARLTGTVHVFVDDSSPSASRDVEIQPRFVEPVTLYVTSKEYTGQTDACKN
ncbi:MAG: hypothetical protein DLM50_09210 [Candidatus Meridianibacter frigidus]|nr:MAG: hypothetical protein DLM50_09210 [Candidatus Eremiobacteraeota bacterium]